MQFTTTLRTDRMQKIKDDVGVGGTLVVYTGSAPGVGNAPTGTLLCTLTAVTFGTAGATMTVSATADSSAAASGTPGYYRFKTSGGTAVIEGTAAVGSGELSFNATVSAGGTVSLSSGTFTEGNP